MSSDGDRPRYPSLFEINTRVWLRRLSREAGRPMTLSDIDDATLDVAWPLPPAAGPPATARPGRPQGKPSR